MDKIINYLGSSFSQMVDNANAGEYWRNVGLGRIAFDMMDRLPDSVPGERTERYEEVIQEVEAECDAALAGIPCGMGFCFAYWTEKRRIL